jgi:hypothetical protein
MAWSAPSDPVGGTVITVAAYVTNSLDNIRWLRLLTGNADPPGSNYVVVSTSTTGTSWQKVPADALAAGVAVSNLGYTPVNKAGDTGIGALTMSALTINSTSGISSAGPIATTGGQGITAAGTITAAVYAGGSLVTGSPSFRGVSVGGDGIASSGAIITSGSAGITAGGAMSAASYGGGSTAAGTPSFLGVSVGASGIATTGSVNPASYIGGSTSSGTPSFLGASVGTGGVASAGAIATSGGTNVTASGRLISQVATGTAPLTVASTTEVANLNVALHKGASASATPTAGTIPIADGSGTLDAWVTPASFSIPSGLGGWVRQASEIPTGFSRETNLDGLIPVGAGTSYSQTFTEGTGYGSNWTPGGYSIPSLSVSVTSVTVTGAATGGPEDNTGGPSATDGLGNGGGTTTPTAAHTHSLNGVSFAVSASGTGSGSTATGTTGSATWLPPSRAVVYVRKN